MTASSRCRLAGGGAFAWASAVKDMALGAISIAEHVHRVAKRYSIYIALHTDHCPGRERLKQLVIPLVEETEQRQTYLSTESFQQPHV